MTGAGQLTAWFLLGVFVISLTDRKGAARPGRQARSVSPAHGYAAALLTGCLAWFTFFEVMTLPCIFLNVSTGMLGLLSLGAALAFSMAGIFCLRSAAVRDRYRISSVFSEHGLPGIIPLLCAVFLGSWQVMYTDTSVDAMYYISVSSTAAYTNTLGHYSAYTGKAVKAFNPRYVFNVFPYYNAAVSRLSGLRTVIQARMIMPALIAVMVVAAYELMGSEFLTRKGKKAADVFALFAVLFLLIGNTQYLPGSFFLGRLYEGKSIIANLIIPALMWTGISYWNEPDDARAAVRLFLCSGAAVCFAGSCIMALAGIPAAMLPGIIKQRRLSKLGLIVIGAFPILCWCGCYFLAKQGILPMNIR